MNDLTIPRDLLEQAADEAGADIEIRGDYSGRGMFGAECLGITSHSASHVYATLARLAVIAATEADEYAGSGLDPAVDVDAVVELVKQAQTDSMGLDTIVYFPGVTLADEDLT